MDNYLLNTTSQSKKHSVALGNNRFATPSVNFALPPESVKGSDEGPVARKGVVFGDAKTQYVDTRSENDDPKPGQDASSDAKPSNVSAQEFQSVSRSVDRCASSRSLSRRQRSE